MDREALDHKSIGVGSGGAKQRTGILSRLYRKTLNMSSVHLPGELPSRAIYNELIVLKKRKAHNEGGSFTFEDKCAHRHINVLHFDW